MQKIWSNAHYLKEDQHCSTRGLVWLLVVALIPTHHLLEDTKLAAIEQRLVVSC